MMDEKTRQELEKYTAGMQAILAELPRKEVEWFADLMEKQLRKNDHKKGWDNCSLLWLIAKLNEEVGELSQLVLDMYQSNGYRRYSNLPVPSKIFNEAADVANIAMMIADLINRETSTQVEK